MPDLTLLTPPETRRGNGVLELTDAQRTDRKPIGKIQKRPMTNTIKVLMELRPALQGFAGIPQETRLLFSAFRDFDGVETTGLINRDDLRLSKSIKKGKEFDEENIHEKINALSRHVVSHGVSERRRVFEYLHRPYEKHTNRLLLRLATLFGVRQEIRDFDPKGFENFVWSAFFSKTLPASEFEKILTSQFVILRPPYLDMHRVGMTTGTFLRYPKVATDDYDIFVSQTPFPGRLPARTQLVVRYHDAIPIFLPHTIPDTRFHQRSHYLALRSNQKTGYFACTSEAVRQDLLRVFPRLETRATVIHDMVSPSYFKESVPRERIVDIIRSRIARATEPEFLSPREKEYFYNRLVKPRSLRYLVMVATIEPRKNHANLIGAWEIHRSRLDPDLKLVFVGNPGWRCDRVLESMKPWQERGQLFNLSAVPAADLRVLYKGAEAVVCPSFAEGFDLSGIEAMLCGGAVAASDIPVHREVYEETCEYFNPYSTLAAADAIERIIHPDRADHRRALVKKGAEFAQRYKRENIAPKWQKLFERFRR